MPFVLRASKLFLTQIGELSKQAKNQIEQKLQIAKENPFHFKSLTGTCHSRVFRIRMNIDGIESRIVYLLEKNEVRIVGIIKRKHDYRELDLLIKKMLSE